MIIYLKGGVFLLERMFQTIIIVSISSLLLVVVSFSVIMITNSFMDFHCHIYYLNFFVAYKMYCLVERFEYFSYVRNIAFKWNVFKECRVVNILKFVSCVYCLPC